MKTPGFKVLHIPDIDFRSHCPTFKACLTDVNNWSQSHKDHLPIIITINPKTSGLDRPGFAKVLPFDKDVLNALDKEIRDVLSEERLITPRQVKGKSRGKILFVFDADKLLPICTYRSRCEGRFLLMASTVSRSNHSDFKLFTGFIPLGFSVCKLTVNHAINNTVTDGIIKYHH